MSVFKKKKNKPQIAYEVESDYLKTKKKQLEERRNTRKLRREIKTMEKEEKHPLRTKTSEGLKTGLTELLKTPEKSVRGRAKKYVKKAGRPKVVPKRTLRVKKPYTTTRMPQREMTTNFLDRSFFDEKTKNYLPSDTISERKFFDSSDKDYLGNKKTQKKKLY